MTPVLVRIALMAVAAMAIVRPFPAAAEAVSLPAPSASDLEETERRLRESEAETGRLEQQARALAKEEKTLREDGIAAAARAQRSEADILALERRLETLHRAEARAAAALKDQGRRLATLLSALQRIARYPPEALVAQPLSPNDTVRGAVLLRSVVPAVERRAAALRRDLDALDAAQEKISRRRAELAGTRAALAAQAAELASLAARKARLHRAAAARHDAAKARVATLAREARSIKDLMKRLEEKRHREAGAAGAPAPAGLSGELISENRGRLSYPAVGRVARTFDSVADDKVTTYKGADIITNPGATVVAPFEGRVVYAGRFRSYGRLLIIEHRGGYHTLLAGLSRLDVPTGTWVLSGEPVGVMGDAETDPPVLYVELRRSGQPIDPLPWLRKPDAADVQG